MPRAGIARIIARTNRVLLHNSISSLYFLPPFAYINRIPSKDIILLHRIICNSNRYYFALHYPPISVYKLQHLFCVATELFQQSPIINYSVTLNIAE